MLFSIIWHTRGLAMQASKLNMKLVSRLANSAGRFLGLKICFEFMASHYFLGNLGKMT